MMAANAGNPFHGATRCRLDRSRALMADLERIWARERAELEELAHGCARHPGKLAVGRALVMLKHWSQERQVHDELLRACGFVRLGG